MAEKWAGRKGLCQGRVLVRREAVVSLETSRARPMLYPWGTVIVPLQGPFFAKVHNFCVAVSQANCDLSVRSLIFSA
jgi:hypothetical protein